MRKQNHSKLALSIAAVLACALNGATAQTLTHRYSFNETAGSTSFTDSIGGAAWNGSLVGTASLDGSQLQLDGFGSFGSLPSGILSGYTNLTVEFWATFSPDNPVWTRTWFIGSQNATGGKATGIDYCHYAGGNWQNMDISSPSGGAYANNPGGLNGQTNVHVTCVVDPANGRMYYYNGTQIRSTLNGGPVPPLNTIVDTFAVIGKSPYDVDATLTGSIDEFRVYNSVITPRQLALNEAAGPNKYTTDPGTLLAVHLVSPANPLAVNELSTQIFTGDFANVTNVDLILYGDSTFTSGNTNIFTVSTNGVVKAIGQGTTTIVASFGGKSATNTLTVVAVPPVLKHRYAFDTDPTDSVGGANGTLQGSATVSGGKLVLDGSSGTYLSLPGPTINIPSYKSVTFQAWVTFGDVPTWSRLFDFGHEDEPTVNAANEIYFAPRVQNGGRHWISENFSGGQTVSWQGTLSNQTAQITCVIDPPTGTLALYRDGKLEHRISSATAPLSLVSNTVAVIGRSLVDADPFMAGSVDEFRIYSGALTPEAVALTYANGPGSTTFDPGALQRIRVAAITYPPYSGRMAPLIYADYTGLTNFSLLPNVSAVVDGLSLTSSDTNVIVVLANNLIQTKGPGSATLTATYLGKTSSANVTVEYIAPQLTHRYSFTANPNDSVGGANGTLQGSATLSGGKLVLDGMSGSYLELPGGLLKGYDALTIDLWADFGAGQNWARLWYFGNDRQDEFYVAPVIGNPADNHRYSTGFAGPSGGNFDIPGRWENTSLHITATYGNGTMSVYTNGVLERTGTVNGRPEQIGEWFSWIGRSPYGADAYVIANVDEFRIYNGRLSDEQILASQQAGPDALPPAPAPRVTITLSGGNVTLHWPASETGYQVQGRASFSSGSWTTVGTPTQVGGEWQLTMPATGTSQFFRLVK